MTVSPYLSQAQYFADELLDLLNDAERQEAGNLIHMGGFDLVLSMSPEEEQAVLHFLGTPPSRRSSLFVRLSGRERLTFWLRARYMALSAVEALLIAQDAEMLLRGNYRLAFQAIAKAVHPYPRLIHKADLLDKRIR